MIPTLVTDRLVLRPPSPCDLGDMIALGQDPEVMQYIGSGQTMSSAQSGYWLECMLADARYGISISGVPHGLPGWLTIIERTTQRFVGLALLKALPPHHVALIGPDLCPMSATEVGYRLAKPFWGMGYATEAGAALMQYGFETMELDRIVAIADVRNLASNRVLEKIGLPLRTTYMWNEIDIHFRATSREEWFASK